MSSTIQPVSGGEGEREHRVRQILQRLEALRDEENALTSELFLLVESAIGPKEHPNG